MAVNLCSFSRILIISSKTLQACFFITLTNWTTGRYENIPFNIYSHCPLVADLICLKASGNDERHRAIIVRSTWLVLRQVDS